MREVWRPVPSVPGLLASSHGRVMAQPYEASMPNGGTRTYGGYPTYGQWDGARFIHRLRGRCYKIARLVCEAFNGPAREDARYCLHKDEQARNNRPENLVWGTQKENLNAPGFIEYCRARTGENSTHAKARRLRAQ